ncbi:hypothetical protein PENTCL1PPCAC_9821, partial [Pristionchus entomophagus]
LTTAAAANIPTLLATRIIRCMIGFRSLSAARKKLAAHPNENEIKRARTILLATRRPSSLNTLVVSAGTATGATQSK